MRKSGKWEVHIVVRTRDWLTLSVH